jgi:polyisoprenoid-binding protein YceI
MKKLLMLALLFCCQAFAEVETYKIDNTHSFANWTIRHVASKTSGTFSDVTGQISLDKNNLEDSSVNAKVNLLSLNSSHVKRDEHIKKPEYLDVEKYAVMTFVSNRIVAKSVNEGVLTGKFTLHGVTKEISFPFKVLGFGADPWGGYRVGLEAHTILKASEYGFSWGVKKDAPIGDDIEVTLLIEGVRFYAESKPLG